MAPSFEQLLQIIRVAACDFDGVHVVLASRDDFTFLEKTARLREELQEATRAGYQVLGLLGWENSNGHFQAHKMFFRWHQSEELAKLFDQICQVGVNSLGPPSDKNTE
jgi:hypothetical protein